MDLFLDTLLALLCIAAAITFALMAVNSIDDDEPVMAVLCFIVAFWWFLLFVGVLTVENSTEQEQERGAVVQYEGDRYAYPGS